MRAARLASAAARQRRPRSWPELWLVAGVAALALPALWHLATAFWVVDEQGHGPVILAAVVWLLWQRRDRFAACETRPAVASGTVLMALALPAYLIGRSQAIVQFEVGAPIVAAVALVLLLRGWAALRVAALPLAFLVFLVPYPGVLVQMLTVPLKTGVSAAAEALLRLADYPVARTGVVLAVGQYHLLVADACAGLTSMFTLEALGLVYISLRGRASRLHDTALALLVIPISFAANVVRVIALALITFHFGEAAQRGFMHGFAGVVLFAVAALLLTTTDSLLGRLLPRAHAVRSRPAPAPRRPLAVAGHALPGWVVAALATGLFAATPLAGALRPTHRSSDLRPPVHLEQQVPARFAGWSEDRGLAMVLPDPQLQATLDATYSQVLARSYVDARGRRVMLSIAYGDDQNSEATAVHRPEFCYRSQGFDVATDGTARLALPGRSLTVQRLIARFGPRFEPITYWVTLDETATLPGLGRKLQQVRYGLRGTIVDGMLVRISTTDLDAPAAYALQQEFAADLFRALPAGMRSRFFGS